MLQQRYILFVRSLLRSVCVRLINMHKGRVHDVTHCYNLGEKCVPPCVISAVSRLRHVGPAVVPQFETCGEKVCKLFNNYVASSKEDRRFCWFMYIWVTYQACSVKMAWYRPNCCCFFFLPKFLLIKTKCGFFCHVRADVAMSWATLHATYTCKSASCCILTDDIPLR